jgi:hypothetical protein
MRAFLRVSASISALAPVKPQVAQSFAISKKCLSNGGRKVVGGRGQDLFNAFLKNLQA